MEDKKIEMDDIDGSYFVKEKDNGDIVITDRNFEMIGNEIIKKKRVKTVKFNKFNLHDNDVATLYDILNQIIVEDSGENVSTMLEAFNRVKEIDITNQISSYLIKMGVDKTILEKMKLHFLGDNK